MGRSKDRRASAFHEAGHTVAARLQGIRVHSVHLSESEEPGEVRFHFPKRARRQLALGFDPELAKRLVRLAVAGAVAESRYLRTGRPLEHLSTSDRETAERVAGPYCERTGRDVEKLIAEAVSDVEATLALNWPAVEALANELLLTGSMTGRGTVDLIESTRLARPRPGQVNLIEEAVSLAGMVAAVKDLIGEAHKAVGEDLPELDEQHIAGILRHVLGDDGLKEACVANKTGRGHHDDETGYPCRSDWGDDLEPEGPGLVKRAAGAIASVPGKVKAGAQAVASTWRQTTTCRGRGGLTASTAMRTASPTASGPSWSSDPRRQHRQQAGPALSIRAVSALSRSLAICSPCCPRERECGSGSPTDSN